jgi:hypothetical protein
MNLKFEHTRGQHAAVTGVVEESAGAAVDRGCGGVGRSADHVPVRWPRTAEGGGQCGGWGGCRWSLGVDLARAVLLF